MSNKEQVAMETTKKSVKRRAEYAGPRGVLAYMKSSDTNCSVETLLELDREEDDGLDEPEGTTNSCKDLCNRDMSSALSPKEEGATKEDRDQNKPSDELLGKKVERPSASRTRALMPLVKSDYTDQPLTTSKTVPNGKHGVRYNREDTVIELGRAEVRLTSCCLEKNKNVSTRNKCTKNILCESEILPFIELDEIRPVDEYSQKQNYMCTRETQNIEETINKSNKYFEERKAPEIIINDSSEGYTYKVKTPVCTSNTKPKPNKENIVKTQDSPGNKNKESRETSKVCVGRRSSFLDRIFRTKKQTTQTNKHNDKKTLRKTSPQRRFLGFSFDKFINKKDDSPLSRKSALSKRVLVQDTEVRDRGWDFAAMERYMREHSEEHLTLGFFGQNDVKSMHCKLDPLLPNFKEHSILESEERAQNEESLQSDSLENTPSNNSSGMDFGFGQKCYVDHERCQRNPTTSKRSFHKGYHHAGRKPKLFVSIYSDQLTSYSGREPSVNLNNDWPCKKHDKPHDKDSSRSLGEATSSASSSKLAGGKISWLLRRTQSAGCSKEVPDHRLFYHEKLPVTKTKTVESSSCEGRDDKDDKKNKERKPLAQDIKFRLSFLRRKQADASLQSVRPSLEEIQKWSESFQELVASKYGLALFRAFLSREFSEENMEFWLACEELKKCRINKLSSKAWKIYNDFIAVQAPREVNIDSTTRNTIFNNLSNPDHHSFDLAQKQIQGLMERDTYLRFLQSELYSELLQENSST